MLWAPDGRFLVSGFEDAAMRVWRAGEDRTVDIIATQVLKGHTDDVTSVTWAPGGRFLASGSADSIVRVWWASKDGTVEGGIS